MKNWKTWLVLFIIGMTTAIVVGCSDDGGSGGNPGPNIYGQCDADEVFTRAYGCLEQCPNKPGYGYLPTTGQCVKGDIGGIFGGDPNLDFLIWTGTLQVTNHDAYSDFLRDNSGLCDTNSNNYLWGFDWGSSSCDSWANGGATVSFEVSSTTLPANGGFIIYPYNMPPGVSASGQVLPYDNNKKFELRAVGAQQWGQLAKTIRVVSSSKLDSSSLTLQLYYGDRQFGTATVQEYNNNYYW